MISFHYSVDLGILRVMMGEILRDYPGIRTISRANIDTLNNFLLQVNLDGEGGNFLVFGYLGSLDGLAELLGSIDHRCLNIFFLQHTKHDIRMPGALLNLLQNPDPRVPRLNGRTQGSLISRCMSLYGIQLSPTQLSLVRSRVIPDGEVICDLFEKLALLSPGELTSESLPRLLIRNDRKLNPFNLLLEYINGVDHSWMGYLNQLLLQVEPFVLISNLWEKIFELRHFLHIRSSNPDMGSISRLLGGKSYHIWEYNRLHIGHGESLLRWVDGFIMDFSSLLNGMRFGDEVNMALLRSFLLRNEF